MNGGCEIMKTIFSERISSLMSREYFWNLKSKNSRMKDDNAWNLCASMDRASFVWDIEEWRSLMSLWEKSLQKPYASTQARVARWKATSSLCRWATNTARKHEERSFSFNEWNPFSERESSEEKMEMRETENSAAEAFHLKSHFSSSKVSAMN